MHRMGNQVGDAVEHGTVPGQARQAGELLGHDQQRKVPAAAGRAGMAGVFGTVVGEFEHDRRERRQAGFGGSRATALMASAAP